MTIKERISALKSKISSDCELIIVSKNRPLNQIIEAYESGHRIFAENRVQNLMERYQSLPKDIEWHLIGQLQTNKVKMIAPFIYMIHSLDNMKLAVEIDKQAKKNNRIIKCLLQLHVAQESTKSGIKPEEIDRFLADEGWKNLKNIEICGIMGMATFTDDKELIRLEFRKLHELFLQIKNNYFRNNPLFTQLSMGMSGDYDIAISEGSTMIRVGSYLFEN